MLKRFLAGLVVVVLASAAVAWFRTDRSVEPTFAVRADAAFDDAGALPHGPFSGRFSPDAGQLLVLSGEDLSVARRGELQQLNEDGTQVIDAAWMPGANGILAAFGPAGNEEMTVYDPAGKILGIVKMKPAVHIAANGGMAVDPKGLVAAVTATDRGGLPGQAPTSSVQLVDLKTGAVTPASPPGVNARGPVWLTDRQLVVAVSEGAEPGRTHTAVLDLDSKRVDRIGPTDGATRPLAVLPGGAVVLEVRRRDVVSIEAFTGEALKPLGTLPPGWAAVHVDPTGQRALVLDTSDTTAAAVRLRSFKLRS